MASVHQVQMGDSYKSLARQYYGNEARHTKIYEANKNRTGSPDHLEPGEHIVIP
jgi:nucleoid-associated protein YgaU